MNNRTKLILGIAVAVALAILIYCVATDDAAADTIHDVAAINSIPELGHENVTCEGSAYFNRVDDSEVFGAGCGIGAYGVGIGGSVLYDTGPMDDETTFAVGVDVPLGEVAGLRIATVPDFDADGIEKVGTVGVTLRFGF